MAEWEKVAENTWRLELNDGNLFRFGASMVYAPTDIALSADEVDRRIAKFHDRAAAEYMERKTE
jgi:hypothetical protein